MQFKTNHSFVLASASPRRKELFSVLDIPFEVITSSVDEKSIPFVNEEQYVRDVALLKTRSIASRLKGVFYISHKRKKRQLPIYKR